MRARRLRLLATMILIVGLCSAAGIYVAARPAPGDPLEREESKQYLRAMELYGGQANLLAAEGLRWFQSLWHGTRLAWTVAGLAVLASGACLFASAAVEE